VFVDGGWILVGSHKKREMWLTRERRWVCWSLWSSTWSLRPATCICRLGIRTFCHQRPAPERIAGGSSEPHLHWQNTGKWRRKSCVHLSTIHFALDQVPSTPSPPTSIPS